MSIHQETRGKHIGKWYFRLRLDGKNIQRGYFSSDSKARKAEALYQLNNSEVILENYTFEDVYQKYREYFRIRNKVSTRYNKEKVFKNYILLVLGKKQINKIDSKIIIAWQDSIYAKGLSHGTNIKIQSELNQFFEYCELNYNLKNPLKKVPPFRNLNNKPKKEFGYWTIEEFQRFFETINNRDHRYYYVSAFLLATRPGEITVLKWKHIDFEKEVITIKDNNMSRYYHGDPNPDSTKTPDSFRKIDMISQLVSLLKEYKEIKKPKEDDYIFSVDGKKPFSDTSIDRWQRNYERLANVPHIRRYDFRSSGLMAVLDAGMDIKTASLMLGHTTPATTQKYYQRAKKGNKEVALENLNKMIKIA